MPNKKQADQIREFVLMEIIEPARLRVAGQVIVTACEVAKGMALSRRYPNICQVLDGRIFADLARVRLVARSGPKQGSTVTWTFSI